MKIAAVVQARMGSTRLPGKVLADLAGHPVLWWVVDRLRVASTLDEVIIATTTEARDDEIAQFCHEESVACLRGDEEDVLNRYHAAANRFGLDAVVRITADCPLLDPHLVDDVVGPWIAQPETYDFIANTLVRKYPRGLDAALIDAEALDRAHREADRDEERIHVTPYLRATQNEFRTLSVEGPVDLSHLRWTLDEPRDLDFLRAIYGYCNPFEDYNWWRLIALLANQPDLLNINRSVRQKALHEG